MVKSSTDELREQLEEFTLHLKPGTTKGKHRTAIFDTVELAELVQSLITQEITKARLDELNWVLDNTMPNHVTDVPEIVDRISTLTHNGGKE